MTKKEGTMAVFMVQGLRYSAKIIANDKVRN